MTERYTKRSRDGRTYSKEVVHHTGSWRPTASRTYYPNPRNTEEIVVLISTIDRPFSYTEIIDSGKLNMSRTTAYKALVSLEDEGRIRKDGRGRYVYIDDKGEQLEMTETVSTEEEQDDNDKTDQ